MLLGAMKQLELSLFYKKKKSRNASLFGQIAQLETSCTTQR